MTNDICGVTIMVEKPMGTCEEPMPCAEHSEPRPTEEEVGHWKRLRQVAQQREVDRSGGICFETDCFGPADCRQHGNGWQREAEQRALHLQHFELAEKGYEFHRDEQGLWVVKHYRVGDHVVTRVGQGYDDLPAAVRAAVEHDRKGEG